MGGRVDLFRTRKTGFPGQFLDGSVLENRSKTDLYHCEPVYAQWIIPNTSYALEMIALPSNPASEFKAAQISMDRFSKTHPDARQPIYDQEK